MATSELRNLHADLKLRYGGKWTDDENRACARLLDDMAKEFGHALLAGGIREYCKANQWFNEDELRATIKRLREPPKRTYCPRCGDQEGWVYVMLDGEKWPRAFRCDHRLAEYSRRVTIREKCPGNEKAVNAMDCDYVDAQTVAYRDPSEGGA